jgi:hypothetical protein
LILLMYPHSSSGYISPVQTLHSCIHLPLLGTYLLSKPFTHVSTFLFWIHISATNLSLMYPLRNLGYISPH